MGAREWTRMVRAGEGLKVEFKRQAPKLDRMAKSFSAFSNSSGGCIFFGVEDDGQVSGLEHLEGTIDLVERVSQFYCRPRIKAKPKVWDYLPGIRVLVVEIPEAEVKPIYAINPHDEKDAWPFFRSDQENLPLDKKSMKTMRRKPSVSVERDIGNLDRHAVHILNHLNDNPRQTINKLAKSCNISSHRAKKIVVHLEQNGWIHGFFNEKRREYSLAIPWRKK